MWHALQMGRIGLTVVLLVACGGPTEAPDGGADAGARDAGRDASVEPCEHACLLTCPLEGCDDPETAERWRARDTDHDGLSDYDELCVHGTSPCEVDTTGDGCPEFAEHVLMEGCEEGDEAIFWFVDPYECTGTRSTEFTVAEAAAEVRLLHFPREGFERLVRPEDFAIRAIEARLPDDSPAGTAQGERFRDVLADARLTFELTVPFADVAGGGPHVADLHLVDGAGTLLERRLLVVFLPYCVFFI